MKKSLLLLIITFSILSFADVKELFTLNLPEDISLITWADIDSNGNTYILDGKDVILVKVNKEGKVIEKITRKGQGPGEFQYSSCIQSVKGIGIFVSDILGKKLELLDSDFKYKKTFPVSVFPLRFVFNSNYFFLMSDAIQNRKYFFVIYRLITKPKPKLEALFKGNELDLNKKNQKIDLDNSTGIFFDANDKYIVFVKQVAYPLMLYYQKVDSSPGSIKKLKLPYNPIPLNEEEKKVIIEETLTVAKQINPAANAKDLIVKNKIACNYLAIDREDVVWLVISTNKKDTFELTSLDLEKKSIKSILKIKGFKNPAVKVKGNFLLLFEKSIIAEPKIRLYKL